MKQQILDIINKYKIPLGLILFFLIWMLFFDEYNWIRIHNDNQKLKNLKEESEYLNKKIELDRNKLNSLQTDTQALEKFAREEYLLKKEDEDVYIIIEDK